MIYLQFNIANKFKDSSFIPQFTKQAIFFDFNITHMTSFIYFQMHSDLVSIHSTVLRQRHFHQTKTNNSNDNNIEENVLCLCIHTHKHTYQQNVNQIEQIQFNRNKIIFHFKIDTKITIMAESIEIKHFFLFLLDANLIRI